MLRPPRFTFVLDRNSTQLSNIVPLLPNITISTQTRSAQLWARHSIASTPSIISHSSTSSSNRPGHPKKWPKQSKAATTPYKKVDNLASITPGQNVKQQQKASLEQCIRSSLPKKRQRLLSRATDTVALPPPPLLPLLAAPPQSQAHQNTAAGVSWANASLHHPHTTPTAALLHTNDLKSFLHQDQKQSSTSTAHASTTASFPLEQGTVSTFLIPLFLIFPSHVVFLVRPNNKRTTEQNSLLSSAPFSSALTTTRGSKSTATRNTQ